MEKPEHNGINRIDIKNPHVEALANDAMEIDDFFRLSKYAEIEATVLGRDESPNLGLIKLLKSYASTLNEVIGHIHKMRELGQQKKLEEIEVIKSEKQEALQKISYCEHQLKNTYPDIYKVILAERNIGNNFASPQ